MRVTPILVLLAVVMPVCGQLTAEEWFEKGNTLYELGRYVEAARTHGTRTYHFIGGRGSR